MIVSRFPYDVGIIGGAGHVGLPLALTFAECGLKTLIVDTNRRRVRAIQQGRMPFYEEGGQQLLTRVRKAGGLEVELTPERLATCRFVLCIVGTPLDEQRKPSSAEITRAISDCIPHLRDGQIFVLRSTVFPGTTEKVARLFDRAGLRIRVAFCPERSTQGRSLAEFRELPQIIAAFDDETLDAVRTLFERFAPECIELTPMEAEFSKLMTNAWRYVQFATVNQLYAIATRNGLDFDRMTQACRHRYPRMADLPTPGFAAGPCLMKDTLQLQAFSKGEFSIGQKAVSANEDLPELVIDLARRFTPLNNKTVGILGMAFKAECDDPRDSLSYKLKALLQREAMRVLTTDPYVKDPELVPVETVVSQSDVLFVATPHQAYRAIEVPLGKLVVDVWNCVSSECVEPSFVTVR